MKPKIQITVVFVCIMVSFFFSWILVQLSLVLRNQLRERIYTPTHHLWEQGRDLIHQRSKELMLISFGYKINHQL